MVTSLINVYLSNTSGPGPKGVMRPMDLEAADVEQFGASDVEQLTWKNLLDVSVNVAVHEQVMSVTVPARTAMIMARR